MLQIKEDYLIKISSRQKFEDDEDEVNISTFGNYIVRDDKRYIIYKEYEEESPEKYSFCIINFEPQGYVTLTKRGLVKSKLVWEKGRRHYGRYSTEHGELMMGVFTKDITGDFSDLGGTLRLNYSMDINSCITSVNEITIKVEKIKNRGEINV